MQYVCDAPGGKTWFRIDTEGEAALEAEAMKNAVETFFRNERRAAIQRYRPPSTLAYFERDIGLNAHIQRNMPMFLSLRDKDGNPLATALLPPEGKPSSSYQATAMGPAYADPFATEAQAIGALERHFGVSIHRQTYHPFLFAAA